MGLQNGCWAYAMLSCCRPPGVEGEDGDEAPPGEEPVAAPPAAALPAAALSGEAHLLALLHLIGVQAWGRKELKGSKDLPSTSSKPAIVRARLLAITAFSLSTMCVAGFEVMQLQSRLNTCCFACLAAGLLLIKSSVIAEGWTGKLTVHVRYEGPAVHLMNA